MSALIELSANLAAAVAAAGRSVVAIRGGRRRPASGVLWRPDLIVTADHALEHDDDLEAVFDDGVRVRATVAGRDPSTDLAVLRADGGGATVAPRADAASLRVGHVVLALGRPDGASAAASMGVMSAVSGPWTTWRGGRIDRFIRADLSLYPGFSGGPLVDASGAVIGINTSGLTRHLAITIPAATVDRVADALAARGRIAHGYLGVGLQPVRMPAPLARALGLHAGDGVIVVGVEPGSPADRGGILMGDVIVSLGGEQVTDVEDLHALLGPDRIGTALDVDLVRAGARHTARVTVGERVDADE